MTKKKVMVIDDEVDFLAIVKLNLEATKKYEVFTTSNGENIIEQIRQFSPDVILLDMLMPKVNGMEVCEMLNSDPIGKDIPIIIVSALSKDEDKYEAYKKGILEYVTKPVATEVLIAKIESAVSLKRDDYE